jgi:DNA-binding transcriptional MerR regulator
MPNEGEAQPLRSIQDVATELGVTTRTIRFYEDKGLLDPPRVGTMRVYSRREVGRLQLILRGKRLGFSLRDIKEFLDLYDTDDMHLEQTRRLLARVGDRIDGLEKQRQALDQTLDELRDIAHQCRDRIAEAG